MRFKKLDLNLLVALDALLDEKSVSRAANRLNITQPAMSAALTRIRDYFDDPILTQYGKRMMPTALAEKIAPDVRRLLGEIESLIAESAEFNPATSDRVFRIGTSDFVLAAIFPGLIRILAKKAPRIRLEVIQPSESLPAQLDQGDIDLAMAPEGSLPDTHPQILCFEEDHVVVGCADNPALNGGSISLQDFTACGHLVVKLGNVNRHSYIENQLKHAGISRRVELTVPSFISAPELVCNTNRLAVMHRRLAKLYVQRLSIKYVEMPIEIPPMKEMLQYHQARSEDQGLQWLIGLLKQVAAEN